MLTVPLTILFIGTARKFSKYDINGAVLQRLGEKKTKSYLSPVPFGHLSRRERRDSTADGNSPPILDKMKL